MRATQCAIQRQTHFERATPVQDDGHGGHTASDPLEPSNWKEEVVCTIHGCDACSAKLVNATAHIFRTADATTTLCSKCFKRDRDQEGGLARLVPQGTRQRRKRDESPCVVLPQGGKRVCTWTPSPAATPSKEHTERKATEEPGEILVAATQQEGTTSQHGHDETTEWCLMTPPQAEHAEASRAGGEETEDEEGAQYEELEMMASGPGSEDTESGEEEAQSGAMGVMIADPFEFDG